MPSTLPSKVSTVPSPYAPQLLWWEPKPSLLLVRMAWLICMRCYIGLLDSISQRDTGWIQIYARNNQEILDSIIQAYKIAESVYVPVMVCYDGYVLSHTEMPVDVPSQEAVDRFLPPYKPHTILDPANPKNYNLVTLANPRINAEGVLCHGYMELRYLLQEALQDSRETIIKVGQEFGELFGRSYANMFWENRLDDADIVIVAMGSLAMEAIFRPFPKVGVLKALKKSRLVVIFDKNISYGMEGATCSEIKSALYGSSIRAVIRNFIVGLGGRDVKAREMVDAVNKSLLSAKEGDLNKEFPEWICAI